MRILYSGMFDLLHVGHIRALKAAKKFGVLIVHIASDKESKCVKGVLRPIIPGIERAEMVKALKFVDEVYYKEKYESEAEVAKKVKADVIVRNKGNKDKFDIGVVYIKRFIPKSNLDTSGIVRKIQGYDLEKKPVGINYVLKVRNKILLQHRDNIPNIRCPNTWAIPGGNIESHENAHLAAIREIKEETGLKVHGDNVIFLTDITYSWGDTNRVFLVKLKKKPKIVESEGRMEWKSFKDIEKLKLADNQKDIIKAIRV